MGRACDQLFMADWLLVIEAFVSKAYKGRVRSCYPCQTLSFKAKGMAPH